MADKMLSTIKIRFFFAALVVFTLAVGYVVFRQSHIEHSLLPAEKSVYPWNASANTDTESSVDLRDNIYNLSFDFKISSTAQYPYVNLALSFDDESNTENLVNWSQYSSIRLRVKCRPENVLNFALYTFDKQVSKFSDITTFRPAIAVFSCKDEWQVIDINLQKLETPEWWLKHQQLNIADRDYRLDQIRVLSIGNTAQSPSDIRSSVIVESIILEGRNWKLISLAAALGLCVWGVIGSWCFSQYFLRRRAAALSTPSSPANTVASTPVIYDQISTDPKHERERSAVLKYLASEYSNPNLSVDTAVSALGINRTKINDILREESGLTFTVYLNKLRLTEAARLLADKHMGVSEAAFAVGYGSLSYFNRLFKKEYGCAPSSYKNSTTPDTDSDPTS